LLAFLFHLGIAAVAAAILATVPALYLAWKTLPTLAKKPPPGRPAPRWDPVELGVHQVIGGGPMPPYIRRPHDELLLALLDPTVRTSRLVVVRGGSSTGKTRAAYEAIAARLVDWYLDYPLDPGALAARLDSGVPPRTVLWLGELRQYADADAGPQVLARLADLLDVDGHLVITTLWPEHWTAYAAAARAGPGTADPAGVTGQLLKRLPVLTGCDPAGIEPAHGGIIDVPDQFTGDDLKAAVRTGDSVLAAAATAAADAGRAGQVTQYLAGVPDLLDRYAGSGGNPYGQAIITAAMDAARLGHANLLPARLIQEAAVGYLTASQRTASIDSWCDAALAWATEELRGAIRALQPLAPASGTGVAGYQVASYLIQHATSERRSTLVPATFWDAILSHVHDPADAVRLADSASGRELYDYAVPLYRRAADAGDEIAAKSLVGLLAEQHDLNELRRRADAGDQLAASRLANLLADRGDLNELRRRADAGDRFAAVWLADLLADRGDLNELRRRADAGDQPASSRLAELLADLLADQVDMGQPPAEPGGRPLPGGPEQIPGQLMLPGMPSSEPQPETRQRALPRSDDYPDRGKADDLELAGVLAALSALDADGTRMAAAIRGALDMLLDGQHTGRYRWDQLSRTEKTHAGTLVEIALARELALPDGTALDYTIAGVDVDCKFSHRLGGWMIPPEADGQLMLLVQASDEDGSWSAGLVRTVSGHLSPAGNRDRKRALNDRGRAAVYWLQHRAPLQENALIRLPEPDVAAIFALPSGQQRVNELFRRAQQMRVSRTVVATVAMQDDYMKRVRDGGGARYQLRAEGIVIFGDYAGDQLLASALDLPRPGPGEFVSARLARRRDGHDVFARSIRLDGVEWLLAAPADPPESVPALPR
jgi:hypothetical protein